jgi:hypothetical protein
VEGKFDHRKAALQPVRTTIEKYEQGRVKEHRMMDWNNHPDTAFAEVKKVLKVAMEVIRQQFK